MTLAGYIMIVFWVGFLLYGMVAWAINKTFEQIKDIDMTDDDIENIL